MATHMLYEMVNHSHNRWLYGKRVTDMPHIKRMMLEAWGRILMSRLYNYRAVDYFRQASPTDRRYLLFHPLQKARSAGECDRAVTLMHNVMAAKAYETDTFAETAVRQIGNSVRLEGTAHVNMSQAVKFARSYFYDNVDLPEVPDGKMIKDDSLAAFNQTFGKVKDIKFADYRKAFAGCQLPNVKIFLEQAEAFKVFYEKAPLTKDQMKNADFLLNVAEIFGAIVYGQLVFEKAAMEEIEDMVIDQLFSYLVRDINNYVARQINEYAGCFESGQREGLNAIVKDPSINFEREEAIMSDYVLALDNAYNGTTGVIIFD
ncbi:MAG: acyl-CoA dehydrogenase family protein, partial [Sporomusa sp.]